VDGLEKEALVRRVGHPHDRRIKLVELTEAGRRVVEQELGPSHAAAAALFDDSRPTSGATCSGCWEKSPTPCAPAESGCPPASSVDPERPEAGHTRPVPRSRRDGIPSIDMF